jgi:DNA polymerase V
MVKQMENLFSDTISLIADKLATDRKHYFVLYCSKVSAGFPSPADDYIDQHIDLTELLIKHPAATYIVSATGDSMLEMGIFDGDLLIVDRSLKACSGNVVIAAVDGQLTVKQLCIKSDGTIFLQPANIKYPPIEIKETTELHVWGVVTCSVHNLLGR